MGETKNTQKIAKAELDHKLSLASPSREILEDLAVACAKDPSPDNTFQYAFCLSKSTQPSELRYAVTILDGLVKEGYEHQVDCLYGAACALYLLGEYDKSRVSTETCLCVCQGRIEYNLDARVTRSIHSCCCCCCFIDLRSLSHSCFFVISTFCFRFVFLASMRASASIQARKPTGIRTPSGQH
jgi:hypothetical protein